MLLQAKDKKMKRDKRGISIVIGYILLIAVSMTMSILVYQWLKTYVPTDSVKCSEGTSLFIKSVDYDCTSKILTLTLQNNGKFGIDGYFIHVSDKPNEELATIDISSKLSSGGTISGNSVRFSETIENSLSPEDLHNVQISSFNVQSYGTLSKVEIIPTRMETISNKKRIVSCGGSKVEEQLACS